MGNWAKGAFTFLRGCTPLQRSTLWLSGGYAAVFIMMLIFRPGSKEFYHGFFNLYQAIPPAFGAVCCLLFAKSKRELSKLERRAWFLVGLGCASFAAGQTTWFVYETVLGVEVPFPGWSDVGYLGAPALVITGVCLFIGTTSRAGRWRVFLDSAIAAFSVGLLSWHFMIQKIWEDTETEVLGRLISIGYPFMDIAAIFVALVVFKSSGVGVNLRRSMVCIGVGMIMIAFADSVFTFMSLNETYETGSWADWGWSFGWLAIAFSALLPLWWAKTDSERDHRSLELEAFKTASNLIRVAAPYAAVILAFGIVVADDYVRDGKISPSVYVEACLIFVLIMLRQVFMLMENATLTKQLANLNGNLENMVRERTEQLSSLQLLTKAVNTTLRTDQVLQEAAVHTRRALRADGVAVWVQQDGGEDARECRLHNVIGLEDAPAVTSQIAMPTLSQTPEHFAVPEISPNGSYQIWTCLRVPLQWHGRPVGSIGVLRKGGTFSAADMELLESIGVEVGTALQHARQHAAALEAADRDPVTNLLNHRALHQRLDRLFKEAEHNGKPLSIIMMDLNNFKLFNDTYGHLVGDQVLKTVSKLLVKEVHQDGLVARYGGDEFAAVLPNADPDLAIAFAEGLISKLANESFCRANDERQIPITLSFGVASYPLDGKNRHEVMAIADTNMYDAKYSGRSIVGSNASQRENRELRAEASFEVLDALVTAVDNKDRYTRKHSEDVTEYALWIAEELGLSEETMKTIRIAGLLHDVGKIGVPDEILRKPGRLTPEEFEVMKRHPRLGELIVGGIPGMESIVDAVRSHHERWDGQGYPDQLGGENIPFLGRLLAVADAFSAMTTDRPYRRGMDMNTALTEIRANIGTQFDPEMAEAFMRAALKRTEVSETRQAA